MEYSYKLRLIGKGGLSRPTNIMIGTLRSCFQTANYYLDNNGNPKVSGEWGEEDGAIERLSEIFSNKVFLLTVTDLDNEPVKRIIGLNGQIVTQKPLRIFVDVAIEDNKLTEKTLITPDGFYQQVLNALDTDDHESSHGNTDDLMERTLDALGYKKGIELIANSIRW